MSVFVNWAFVALYLREYFPPDDDDGMDPDL